MHRHSTVNDETMVARRRSAKEIFTRMSAYVRRYPWYAIGTMACAVVTTLSTLAFPKLTQLVIDEVIRAKRGGRRLGPETGPNPGAGPGGRSDRLAGKATSASSHARESPVATGGRDRRVSVDVVELRAGYRSCLGDSCQAADADACT